MAPNAKFNSNNFECYQIIGALNEEFQNCIIAAQSWEDAYICVKPGLDCLITATSFAEVEGCLDLPEDLEVPQGRYHNS